MRSASRDGWLRRCGREHRIYDPPPSAHFDVHCLSQGLLDALDPDRQVEAAVVQTGSTTPGDAEIAAAAAALVDAACAPFDNPQLGSVIGAFKSLTTHAYIQGVTGEGWPAFPRRLWQRNYYERIMRDERALQDIRTCIEQNPQRWDQWERCGRPPGPPRRAACAWWAATRAARTH
jgi:hypothetical protein